MSEVKVRSRVHNVDQVEFVLQAVMPLAAWEQVLAALNPEPAAARLLSAGIEELVDTGKALRGGESHE